MKKLILFIPLILFLGCKTVEKQTKTDNSIKIVEKEVIKYVFDSVLIERTDTFRQYLMGDTIIIEQIKWRNREKTNIRTDTLLKNDTLFVTKIVENTTKVIEKLPFWKRAWFAYTISVLFFALFYYIKKQLRL